MFEIFKTISLSISVWICYGRESNEVPRSVSPIWRTRFRRQSCRKGRSSLIIPVNKLPLKGIGQPWKISFLHQVLNWPFDSNWPYFRHPILIFSTTKSLVASLPLLAKSLTEVLARDKRGLSATKGQAAVRARLQLLRTNTTTTTKLEQLKGPEEKVNIYFFIQLKPFLYFKIMSLSTIIKMF